MASDPPPHRSTRPPAGPVRVRLAFALVAGLAVLLAACSSGSTSSPTTSTPARPSTTGGSTGLPAIHHVFVIVLENQGYDNTFGDPSADPYLATALPASGALLSDYYGIGHNSNDNYIALISGQAPNPSNQADCPVFADFPPTATVAGDGQISDSGLRLPHVGHHSGQPDGPGPSDLEGIHGGHGQHRLAGAGGVRPSGGGLTGPDREGRRRRRLRHPPRPVRLLPLHHRPHLAVPVPTWCRWARPPAPSPPASRRA